MSVPISRIEAIQQTLDEYLPKGTRSPEFSLCIGEEGGKGTFCVTCCVCFSRTGGKDDGRGRGITFELSEEGCDVFFTNHWMFLEMSYLARN